MPIDNDSEKYRTLMALAEFQRKIREGRRQLEWRSSLSFWTLLAVARIYTKDVSGCLLAIGVLALVLIHAWFISDTWRRNGGDIHSAQSYAKQVTQIILPKAATLEEPDHLHLFAAPPA
jgi:hypothetical protein